MNIDKINKIEKIKDQVMYLDKPGEFISDVCGKLNELIDALQDGPEDVGLVDYESAHYRGEVHGYKIGYQQAIKDAIAKVSCNWKNIPYGKGLQTYILDMLKNLQEK